MTIRLIPPTSRRLGSGREAPGDQSCDQDLDQAEGADARRIDEGEGEGPVPDAKAPRKPAASDGRQAVMMALSVARSRTSSQADRRTV